MAPGKFVALFVLLAGVILFAACGGDALPPEPENIPSSVIPSLSPTPTFIPSPTATPQGGGGTILMGINQLLVPDDIDQGVPFVWLASAADGTNLKKLEFEIYGVSPDGRRMLVRQGEKITLINPDGSNAVPLGTGKDTLLDLSYGFRNDRLILYTKSMIWLSGGRIVFLATDRPGGSKSFYVVNLDGSGLRRLELSSASALETTRLLFESPDGSGFYWVTGSRCDIRDVCNEKYYFSLLDDSGQQEVWQQIENAGDKVYLSPSGQYLAYSAYYGEAPADKIRNGCYLATLAGELVAKMESGGLVIFCNKGDRWSPTEDKILGYGWRGSDRGPQKYFVTWSAPNGEITRLPSYNAGDCYSAEWMPDGRRIFLAVCVETLTTMSALDKSLGQRMIYIEDMDVVEYPDFGNCDYVLSPDAQWAFFYGCKNLPDSSSVYAYPSQLLNLNTGEAHPVFANFVSNQVIPPNEGWWSFWVP